LKQLRFKCKIFNRYWFAQYRNIYRDLLEFFGALEYNKKQDILKSKARVSADTFKDWVEILALNLLLFQKYLSIPHLTGRETLSLVFITKPEVRAEQPRSQT